MKTSTSKSSVVTQILLAVVAIVLGYLLLFNKSVQVTTLCQILCGGLIAVGVVSIASFFISNDFKRIDRYGFALGTMLVLMGFIGLIRMEDVTAHFEIYTGILSLVLGVLVLQGTVQVKVLDYAVWVLDLVLALVCLGGAFCVLSQITAVTGLVAGFSNWLLLICGACCLFSMLVTWFCIMLAGRREKKAAAQREAEEQARKEAEEKARKDAELAEQARKVAEEHARREAAEQARREAEEKARKEYEAQQAAAAAPAQPAETHHAGFDTASDVPPAEAPELVFGAEEGHHADFDPTSGK